MCSWWSAEWSRPSSWCARRKTLLQWWRRCWLGLSRKRWTRSGSFSSARIWRVVRSSLVNDCYKRQNIISSSELDDSASLESLGFLAASCKPQSPGAMVLAWKGETPEVTLQPHLYTGLYQISPFWRSHHTLQHQHCQMWWNHWTWRQKKRLPWLRNRHLFSIWTVATPISLEGLSVLEVTLKPICQCAKIWNQKLMELTWCNSAIIIVISQNICVAQGVTNWKSTGDNQPKINASFIFNGVDQSISVYFAEQCGVHIVDWILVWAACLKEWIS